MKLLISALILVSLCFACKKNASKQTAPDYSLYKIKKAVSKRTTYSGSSSSQSFDTTSYTYSGTAISYELRKSTGLVSVYNYKLADNIYTQEQFNNGVISTTKGYYRRTGSTYIDTFWLATNGTVTQSGKYEHNPDGTFARDIIHYSGYDNDNKYVYQNGNILYGLFVRNSFSPSIAPARDSVVMEYYSNLSYRADYYNTGLPSSFFSKPAVNLLKKATYYDLLNNKNIRQTAEYSYQTDELGLVTKRTFSIYTQPGNVLGLSDTTYYIYYNR
ncbi:MAG: hypothetical protein KA821_18420 [Chitinophagaceae bacterium]|nr:hypothetical protein [Chitinophagaceae bacterium]